MKLATYATATCDLLREWAPNATFYFMTRSLKDTVPVRGGAIGRFMKRLRTV